MSRGKYCLVLSSDERFWSQTDPLLFMDPGCVRYSKLGILKDREFAVNDPTDVVLEGFDTANEYLRDVQNRIENELVWSLNSIHGVDYSVKAWETLIGWWLNKYIAYHYYKYNLIRDIDKQYDVYCLGSDRILCSEVRTTIHALDIFSKSDLFNALTGARIAGWLGLEVKYEVSIPEDEINELRFPPKHESGRTGIFQKGIAVVSKRGKDINYGFIVQLKWLDVARSILFGRMKYVAEASEPDLNSVVVRMEKREKLFCNYNTTDDFERMLCDFLPKDFPVAYIEAFDLLKHKSREYFGIQKRSFYSQNAWYYDELSKSYLAAERQNGLKVYGISHGGTAVNKEDIYAFDTRCVDCYYTWGWGKDFSDCEIKPMPSIKLSSEKKGSKTLDNPSDEILYVGNAFPRYVMEYRYKYSAIPSRYIDDQVNIIIGMHKRGIRYRARLYPHDYGWDLKERLLLKNEKCKIDNGQMPFINSLQNSKMCVFDIVMTSWTEAFVLGKPVMFIIPEYYEYYTEEFLKDIDRLKRVGIFHSSIEDALDYLKTIEDSIEEWWMESSRQNAINEFALRFAYHSDDYKTKWYDEITNKYDRKAR